MTTKKTLGEGRGLGRRGVLKLGAGTAAAALIPGLGSTGWAWAQEQPPLGTWPAGVAGDTVYIGAAVPLTGTYAVQGEDERKGMELAVEHINTSHPLMKELAPGVDNGLLGKKLEILVADSAANPNQAVQAEQSFINQNNVMMMTGSTSSSVAVALNKLADREKIIYLPGISGSNDTTGKDCARYGFRQGFFGEMAANAIGPTLVKNFGENRKAAYMTPDYTYGHTVTESVSTYLRDHAGWEVVTNQVSPLGTQDFSQYLTNIANSGADFLINVNWGRDAVLSTQQAAQFGIIPAMTLVVPYQIPFLAPEAGPELTEGVFACTEFWWTLEDEYPLVKQFVEAFQEKYGYRPEWGAENGYVAFAHWARMITEANSFYPADVIAQYEKGETIPSLMGDVFYRPEDHQCVRPVCIVRGKARSEMQNDEDFWEVVEVLSGPDVIQPVDYLGCELGEI